MNRKLLILMAVAALVLLSIDPALATDGSVGTEKCWWQGGEPYCFYP